MSPGSGDTTSGAAITGDPVMNELYSTRGHDGGKKKESTSSGRNETEEEVVQTRR